MGILTTVSSLQVRSLEAVLHASWCQKSDPETQYKYKYKIPSSQTLGEKRIKFVLGNEILGCLSDIQVKIPIG